MKTGLRKYFFLDFSPFLRAVDIAICNLNFPISFLKER